MGVVVQIEIMMISSDQAEKMAKKADAWKEYKEAAMVDMMLQTLPKAKILIQNNIYFTSLMVKT